MIYTILYNNYVIIGDIYYLRTSIIIVGCLLHGFVLQLAHFPVGFFVALPEKSIIFAGNINKMTIDTTNMCSHLQKKLFDEDGVYHHLWKAMQDDPELTAIVRSRQLHIYRNGKKVLVLAGKSAPKIIREDKICDLL